MTATRPGNADALDTIRVLHVDDDRDFGELAAVYLEEINERIAVTTERTSEAAIKRLDDGDFDCIVSDYDMPGSDGIELLNAIRRSEQNLPFILLTGKGSEEVASEAISVGVSDYVEKGGMERFELLAKRIVTLVDRAATIRSLRQFKQIAEAAGHAIYVTDSDGVIEYVNPAFESITGFPRSEVIGDTAQVLDSGEMPNGHYTTMWERIRAGEMWEGEVINRKRSGEIYHAHQTVAPVTDGADHIDGFVAIQSDITERKMRERELEETKQRLELAMAKADSGIWEWDIETGELYWSDELLEIFGYTQDDFDDTIAFFNDKLHPDDAEATEDAMATAIETAGSYRVEQRLETADGRYRWIDVRGQVIEDHESTRVVGIGIDVTERKAQVRRLAERVKELQGIRQTVEVIEGHDGDAYELLSAIVEFLPASFQYPELTEVKATYGIEEATTDRFDETTARIHSAAVTTNGHRLRLDVGVLAVNDSDAFLDQEQDVLDTIVAFLREYFDKEAQLDKLRAAEQRYETMLTQLADFVTVIDEHAVIRYVSPAIESITGFEPAEIIGTRTCEFVFEEDHTRAAEAIDRTLDGPDGEVTFEFRLEMADGSLRWFEARGKNYLDEPLIDGILVAVRDITDRKSREADLQRETDRLEAFVGVVAHDLRNPLNVATGRVELIKATGDVAHVTHIERALSRMENLISDLLTLARFGNEVDELDAVHLAEIAHGSWEMVETSEAELVVKDNLVSHVWADPNRLRQVFENLYRNAIEHGGNAVTVSGLPSGNGIALEDDGDGIPAGDREQVFEPGYSSNNEGTGFGLAIVREIVRAHGWEINVGESADGGARFEITGMTVVGS